MTENDEIRLQGRAVSRGIAVGQVVCLYGNRRQFVRRSLSENEIPNEIELVRSAHALAIESLNREIERSKRENKNLVSDILDSHSLLLEDPLLQKQIVSNIEIERVNAESAVLLTFEEIGARFRGSTDENFREKLIDLEDVAERLLAALGAGTDSISLPPDSIIVASEVRPSALLEFVSSGAVGLIAESGGWTSHTSILARESKIPAVTGMRQISKLFRNGQFVIVDGFTGEVVLNPSKHDLNSYRSRRVVESEATGIDEPVDSPTRTLDGREITTRTNATSVGSYRIAARRGAKGIGLYRSESLISKFKRIPTEDEQVAAYVELADVAGADGIRIRTFDIDPDQLFETGSSRQKNPALGVRAIRLGIAHPELLETQVRALLRAAHGRKISVTVPMVTGISEIDSVKALITKIETELSNEGTSFGKLSLGAMIEIPSAILLADQLAEVSDFLCLGTNDLAQYLLAADRDNDSVANWFRTLHPAMIRAVKHVIDVSKRSKKPLIVCGEMAGSPFYVPVLIGLGAVELSMNPSSIDAVRRVISGVAFEETATLVSDLHSLNTAEEVESAVAEYAKGNWPHLYAPGFLESQGA